MGVFFLQKKTEAYGECSQYGTWATYDSYSNTCKCMSGYVFGKLLGQDYCVSGDSICYDKYGYGSDYDSLSGSCECSYGYVFGTDSIGRTQCITEDQACKNQLGYNARSSLGRCECGYGYVISGGQCTDGDSVCRDKHGIYSSYTSYNNSCECDDGYTLDDYNQCVKKQNNVYFTLKELDTDNREAIIRSDYDFRYYHIRYGVGCFSSSFRGYLNSRIVVNLGTDFDLDIFDTIVLQDDDETCDILSRTKVDSSFTMEKDETIYVPVYIPTAPTPIPTRINPTPVLGKTPIPAPLTCEDGSAPSLDKKTCVKIPNNSHPAYDGKNIWLCNEGYVEKGNACVLFDTNPLNSSNPTPIEVPVQSQSWGWLRIFKFWTWFN